MSKNNRDESAGRPERPGKSNATNEHTTSAPIIYDEAASCVLKWLAQSRVYDGFDATRFRTRKGAATGRKR